MFDPASCSRRRGSNNSLMLPSSLYSYSAPSVDATVTLCQPALTLAVTGGSGILRGMARSITQGTIYEDCAFHPVLCTYASVPEDELHGIPFIDGSAERRTAGEDPEQIIPSASP